MMRRKKKIPILAIVPKKTTAFDESEYSIMTMPKRWRVVRNNTESKNGVIIRETAKLQIPGGKNKYNGLLIKYAGDENLLLLLCNKDGELAALKKNNISFYKQIEKAALNRIIDADEKKDDKRIKLVTSPELEKKNAELFTRIIEKSSAAKKPTIYAIKTAAGTAYGHLEKDAKGAKIIVFDVAEPKVSGKKKNEVSPDKQETTDSHPNLHVSSYSEINTSFQGVSDTRNPYNASFVYKPKNYQTEVDNIYALWINQIRARLSKDINNFHDVLKHKNNFLIAFYQRRYMFMIRDLVLTLLDNQHDKTQKLVLLMYEKNNKWIEIRLVLAHTLLHLMLCCRLPN